jgi:DNA-binding FadR family transcriptional regulator
MDRAPLTRGWPRRRGLDFSAEIILDRERHRARTSPRVALTPNLVTRYPCFVARKTTAPRKAAQGARARTTAAPAERGERHERPRHAADPVFEQLAHAILDGSLAPGTTLPPERELGERFGVSRLIVRQAVHRLADIGLVRVRQGGPSHIVHPNEARDLRIIDLVYRLGRGSPREARELIERQFLHGYSLLFLAARRASKERLRAIAAIAEEYASRGAPGAEMMAFEERFFTALAEATDNRFYMLETSWWFRMITGRPPRPAAFTDEQRAAFYHELARRLADDRDAATWYIATLAPLFDTLGAMALLGAARG